MRAALMGLPPELTAVPAFFEQDALSREACLLCIHTFWYIYCALEQRGSEFQQTGLLRMMSQACSQAARPSAHAICTASAFAGGGWDVPLPP